MKITQAEPAGDAVLDEVLVGLRKPIKTLPSKLFYDKKGSELFEQITQLDEYYLTRTELGILEKHIGEIASIVGEKALVVELGSGSSRKSRLLLDHLPEVAAYVPVDIAKDYLLGSVASLKMEYPDLMVKPVVADYTRRFEIATAGLEYRRQIIFYPGSSIGNFKPSEAQSFMERLADSLDPDGLLLIGVDLKKDAEVLERAYNDEEGVTAEFNKNMLARLNRELGTQFDPDQFEHFACYNEAEGRIEMHLISKKNQKVRVGNEDILFREGESIKTENSYKFSVEEFEKLSGDVFRTKRIWIDDHRLFGVFLMEKNR